MIYLDIFKYAIYNFISNQKISPNASIELVESLLKSNKNTQKRLLSEYVYENTFLKEYHTISAKFKNIDFIEWLLTPIELPYNTVYLFAVFSEIFQNYYDPNNILFIDSYHKPYDNKSIAKLFVNIEELVFYRNNDYYLDTLYNYIERLDDAFGVFNDNQSYHFSVIDDIVDFLRRTLFKKTITVDDCIDFFNSQFIDLQKHKFLLLNIKEINAFIL